MRAGLKKIHSASLITLLLFLPALLALAPTTSASSHESLCILPDAGICDEWDRLEDQTQSSQTWINSQYNFNMIDTSQVELEMVWAIHEFERESFGEIFDLFDLGTGSVPSRDGIPADYIRNYLGVESDGTGTPTVGEKLLSEAEGIIVDMLDNGFGAQTQATAVFTESAIVDGSPIACESDPTKDASGAPENALQNNAFLPALCLKVSATVDLDASAVNIDSDDSPRSRVAREVPAQGGPVVVWRFYHLPQSVEADDFRRTIKGTEHHDNATVFSDVCDCLRAAAHLIKISNLSRIKYSQGVEAFWGEV